MTIRNNCEWLWNGVLHATASVDEDGVIRLTMTGGYDPTDKYTRLGDSWIWGGSVEDFLEAWVFVKEIEPEVEQTPLAETWLIVCRFRDGVDFNDGLYFSREEAQKAYDEEPYDIATGERVELLDIVRVPYYG
jgi:hypothetical protein